MTNNALVKRKHVSYLPAKADLEGLELYANTIYASGLIPSSLLKAGDTKEAILAKLTIIFFKGLELEISPMQALAEIGVINGTPLMSSKLMLALIYRNCPWAEIIYDEISINRCRVRARRHPRQQFTQFEYTIEEAKKAGLVARSPNTWNKYPRQMVKWRAVSNMARTIFPDVIMGCYLPNEILIENKDDQTFGNTSDKYISIEEEEALSKERTTIDKDNYIDEDETIPEGAPTQDNGGLTPSQIYQLSQIEDEEKKDPPKTIPKSSTKIAKSIGLDLDFPSFTPKSNSKDLPSPKKIISLKTPSKKLSPLKKINEIKQIKQIKQIPIVLDEIKITTPKVQKIIIKEEIPKVKDKKPTTTSALNKIKKLAGISTKIEKPVLKKEIDTPVIKLKSKKLSQKKTDGVFSESVINELWGKDCFGSFAIAQKITGDYPWNTIQKISEPLLNATSKEDINIFNTTVAKYFNQFMDEGPIITSVSTTLLEAIEQYCEVDIMNGEESDQILTQFKQHMFELHEKIFNEIKTIESGKTTVTFRNSLLTKLSLSVQYREWLLGYAISRGMIKIDGDVVEILI